MINLGTAYFPLNQFLNYLYYILHKEDNTSCIGNIIKHSDEFNERIGFEDLLDDLKPY